MHILHVSPRIRLRCWHLRHVYQKHSVRVRCIIVEVVFTERLQLKLRHWWEAAVASVVSANVESSKDSWIIQDDVTVRMITEESSLRAQKPASGVVHDQSDAVNGRSRDKVLYEQLREPSMAVYLSRLRCPMRRGWSFVRR